MSLRLELYGSALIRPASLDSAGSLRGSQSRCGGLWAGGRGEGALPSNASTVNMPTQGVYSLADNLTQFVHVVEKNLVLGHGWPELAAPGRSVALALTHSRGLPSTAMGVA